MSIGSTALRNWLYNLHLDTTSIDRIIGEEFTLEDFLVYVTRSDLRALRLKGGVELRIWRAICEARKRSTLTEDDKDDQAMSLEFLDALDSCHGP